MQCVRCQHENASDAKFCNQCAAPFAPVCSACGHENPANAKFCNQCGAALRSTASAVSSVQPMPPEAESESRFHVLFRAVMGQLWSEKRLTYRELKHGFGLDDRVLTEIREELLFKHVARDEAGKGLVWTGEVQPIVPHAPAISSQPIATDSTLVLSPEAPVLPPLAPEPERV